MTSKYTLGSNEIREKLATECFARVIADEMEIQKVKPRSIKESVSYHIMRQYLNGICVDTNDVNYAIYRTTPSRSKIHVMKLFDEMPLRTHMINTLSQILNPLNFDVRVEQSGLHYYDDYVVIASPRNIP